MVKIDVMTVPTDPLLASVAVWLEKQPKVQAAILFGSSARGDHMADAWSDADLQLVTSDPEWLERIDWQAIVPNRKLCLQVVRPATGGTRKVTAVFESGQLDLVIVPLAKFARWRRALAAPRRDVGSVDVQVALDEIFVCIRTGYRFLKGGDKWAAFYRAVLAAREGVRVSNANAARLAGVFLADLLWVLQKLRRGELIAAQGQLHRSLVDINLRLVRELRLREGRPVPSFGLGRHAEKNWSARERGWVTVDARLDEMELREAAGKLLAGLEALMKRLDASWRVPAPMLRLLRRAGLTRR